MQGYAYAGIVAAIVVGGPVTTAATATASQLPHREVTLRTAISQAANVAAQSMATTKLEYTAEQTVSPRPQPVLDVAAPRPAATRTIYLPQSGRPEPLPLAQPPLPVLRPTPVDDHQQPVPASKPVQVTPVAPAVQPAETRPQPARRPARVRHHRQPVPRPFQAAPQIQMPAAPPLRQAIPPLLAPVQQYPQPVAGLLPVQDVPQVQMPAPVRQAIPLPSVAPTSQPSQTPAISMLTTSEIGMGHHASWAPVLGIAVAAEVALLWVAACLSMWRRRLAFSVGYALPHPARTLTKMCRELRKARLPFRRRS